MHQDLGQADMGKFLEPLQSGICAAAAFFHYLSPQNSGDSAFRGQPHIFFLFSSRLAHLCEDHSQPGRSVVFPCDRVLFPPHQVTKQINMFTVTHAESSLFWLKEEEDLTLSPSLAWKASRTSSGFASPILWKGDLSVSIWLKKFLTLTTLCVAGPT